MKRFTDSRIFIAGVPLLFFLLLAAGSEYLLYLGKGRRLAREKEAVVKEAGRVRTLLESEINTTLNLTLGLVIYVASNSDVSQETFSSIARLLIRRTPIFATSPWLRPISSPTCTPLQETKRLWGFATWTTRLNAPR